MLEPAIAVGGRWSAESDGYKSQAPRHVVFPHRKFSELLQSRDADSAAGGLLGPSLCRQPQQGCSVLGFFRFELHQGFVNEHPVVGFPALQLDAISLAHQPVLEPIADFFPRNRCLLAKTVALWNESLQCELQAHRAVIPGFVEPSYPKRDVLLAPLFPHQLFGEQDLLGDPSLGSIGN